MAVCVLLVLMYTSYMKYFLIYICTLPWLILGDLLWLGVIMRPQYAKVFGHLFRSTILLWPALLFYILFTIGLVVFAVVPALDHNSFIRALCLGALLGFIAYMTYDFTNAATLKEWPLGLLMYGDILWGTFISGLSAGLGFLLFQQFTK